MAILHFLYPTTFDLILNIAALVAYFYLKHNWLPDELTKTQKFWANTALLLLLFSIVSLITSAYKI